MSADDYFRHNEGDAARRVKTHEGHPDPDWSMAELSRDKADLAAEFYDWLFERGGAKDDVQFRDLFDRWCDGRWEDTLTRSARAMLLFAVRARQRTQGAVDLPFKSRTEQSHYEAVVRANPRRLGEGQMAYIERLAVNAGGMQPAEAVLNDPRKTEWFDPITVARSKPTVPEVEIRLPYRDHDDPEVP